MFSSIDAESFGGSRLAGKRLPGGNSSSALTEMRLGLIKGQTLALLMDDRFLGENFLLSNPTAEKLYFEFAQPQPIFDYHCHIPPADIAGNRRFENLTQIWLAEGRYGGSLQMESDASQRSARTLHHVQR
jgi:hypothetical protein